MVAESPAKPPKAQKKSNFGPGFRIPLAIRLTVRSLYVVQGFGPVAIAPMVGLTEQQVKNMVSREGWTSLRGEKKAGKPKDQQEEVEALQLAHAKAEAEKIHELVAVRSEELAIRGLDLCAENLDAKDAKGFQMASGGARNMYQMARSARGLDQRNGPQNQGNGNGSTTHLIFVGALERTTPKELKPAEPVPIEVSAKTPELT